MNWEYTLIAVPLALGLIGVGLAIWCYARIERLQNNLQQQQAELNSAKLLSARQVDEIHEIRAGALGVSAKVKDIAQSLNGLTDKVNEIELTDPEVRLYAQASKMAEAGASVEELMQECELPRAEAELLVSVNAAKRS